MHILHQQPVSTLLASPLAEALFGITGTCRSVQSRDRALMIFKASIQSAPAAPPIRSQVTALAVPPEQTLVPRLVQARTRRGAGAEWVPQPIH